QPGASASTMRANGRTLCCGLWMQTPLGRPGADRYEPDASARESVCRSCETSRRARDCRSFSFLARPGVLHRNSRLVSIEMRSCKCASSNSPEIPMTRTEATERILAAKQKKGITYAELARTIGRHPVWVTAALLGQATMSAEEASKAAKALDLGPEVAAALQEVPTRGAVGEGGPGDPVPDPLSRIVEVDRPSLKTRIPA